jgi:hypothetical protein
MKFDGLFEVAYDPGLDWIDSAPAIEAAVLKFASEKGWEDIPGSRMLYHGHYIGAFRYAMLNCDGPSVFGLIELAIAEMQTRAREPCRARINQIFDVHGCPWRIADGEIFKLDEDLMAARLARDAGEILIAQRFFDAAEIFAEARAKLARGQVRDAILEAQKSFETAMRAMTGVSDGDAVRLIQRLSSLGYFDELPKKSRGAISENILRMLPLLSRKLGAAALGQPEEISSAYGQLAIHLAAAFHIFLVTLHVERPSEEASEPETVTGRREAAIMVDNDIPF